MSKLKSLARVGAAVLALSIVLLSLVPSSMRAHILRSDHLEHFVAYLAVASLWTVGNRNSGKLLASGLLLAIGAGFLEVAQLWIPGRTASIVDFASSAIGAWVGLLLVIVVRRAHARAFVISYK